MPISMPLPEAPWQPPRVALPSPETEGGGADAMVAAAAAVMGIVAHRAGVAGLLPRLRSLIDDALDAAEPTPDLRSESTCLPDIADADPTLERRRLAALARRQRR